MAKSAKKRILIVEDDVGIREALAEALQLEGYLTVSAVNGQEAIDLLYKMELPDLVLTDILMPIKNGNEVISEMQGNPLFAGIPIIVMSSALSNLTAKKVSATLSKPVELPHLFKLIVSFVERPS